MIKTILLNFFHFCELHPVLCIFLFTTTRHYKHILYIHTLCFPDNNNHMLLLFHLPIIVKNTLIFLLQMVNYNILFDRINLFIYIDRVIKRQKSGTSIDNEWYNEWQRVKTSDNEWQRVTTNNNEWQQMRVSSTANKNE